VLKSALLLLLGIACKNDEPPFEIVRVPQTAYAAPHEGGIGATDADKLGTDGGREPVVVCIPELSEAGEEADVAKDYPTCLLEHEGRKFDNRATERHRKKDDESEVCCYRR
jgi:hypothetical protein